MSPVLPSPAAVRPARKPPAAPSGAAAFTGKLEWRRLLEWLLEDGLISADDSEHLVRRFGAGPSSLHPLVRLGGAGLKRLGSERTWDTEALTEFL